MSPSHYETSDIHLASFLLCQGANLLNCQRVSARRNLFTFSSDVKLHEMLRLYWSNVPITFVPALLVSSFQRLKSLARKRPGRRPDSPAEAPNPFPSAAVDLRTATPPANPSSQEPC